jgi:predicted nucleotidyltransferase
MNIENKQKELVLLCKKYNLLLFVLFGSYSKNKQDEKSDIDFAFLPNRNFNEENYFEFKNKIIDI